jgi:hypothetical protein
MKKILLITLGLTLLSCATFKAEPAHIPPDTLTATQVYNDVKSLYKDDLKDIVKYSVNKADTLISKGYRVLSKGAVHTYDILIYQQKVKSIHHLFYWLVGIGLTIVMYKRVKVAVKDPTESNIGIATIIAVCSLCLDIYNSIQFNEMLTGFMNPEYGAIKEIIQNL